MSYYIYDIHYQHIILPKPRSATAITATAAAVAVIVLHPFYTHKINLNSILRPRILILSIFPK